MVTDIARLVSTTFIAIFHLLCFCFPSPSLFLPIFLRDNMSTFFSLLHWDSRTLSGARLVRLAGMEEGPVTGLCADVVSGESWALTRWPTGRCANPMQRGEQGPQQSLPRVPGQWGAALGPRPCRAPDGTHRGPSRGRQPHRGHVGAAYGLDLLQVLVKVFLHELRLKHKTVQRYITF